MKWKPCTLTAEDKAAIDAKVAAMPALSAEALDEIALILAAFRHERRRRAVAEARVSA